MKIAFVISVVGPVKRGGESTSLGLVRFLQRHAHVRTLSGGPFPVPGCESLGFPGLPAWDTLYERLPPPMRRLARRLHADPLSIRNWRFCRRVVRRLLADPPDLVLFRSVGPWGAKAGRRIRSSRRVPFVTIEGGWRKGEREVARYHPNLHIAVNVDVAAYLRKQLPAVPIAHLPNGIDLSAFPPDIPAAPTGLPHPVFLGCGFLDPVKRFDLSIRAVSALERGSLLLLGKGPLRDSLQALGTQSLGTRFRLDAVPYERMPAFYRSAAAVTVPSSGESFGMVYLEAMACGRPVVATRDANRECIVGNGGILVDPLDVPAYTNALHEAASRSWGSAPREQAALFDWSVIGPRYLEALHTTLATPVQQASAYPISRCMGD